LGIRRFTPLLSSSLFPFTFSGSCNWVIPVSANALFVQALHAQTDVYNKKQALYNLFAAYVHTAPLEDDRASNERGETLN
jgi:hypothetical protein